MDLPTEDGSTSPGRLKAGWGSIAAFKRGLNHIAESHILFPLIAFLALAAIWGTTLRLIESAYDEAEYTASVSARELAETYRAQVLRALREIDQTLKVIKYEYEIHGNRAVLEDLKERNLLPPALVFDESITDSKGNIVSSTSPSELSHAIDRDDFRNDVQADDIAVSLPQKSSDSDGWKLQFSRRLDTADGKLSGLATLTVDAAYFVSGYEQSKLGEHGLLGIVGTDGAFRVKRSGETVTTSGSIDYAAVVPATEEAEGRAKLSTNAWDGIRRYTSASPIYGFPLAVVVGLSEQEQLAAARTTRKLYLWRAAGGSLLLLVIVGILDNLSRRLTASRQRAVEEHIANAARVEYLAFHDGLTGLPNRSLFSKLLAQSISQAHRHHSQLAVLFLDLDRFKYINDTLGHEAGDQLLQEVASRLKECLRESDTVARLGGDEFVVILREIDAEKYMTAVSQKIISAIARPFILLGQEFRVTVSIGISVYPQDGLDEQTLTKNADMSMYQAKKLGKNNFQFYSEKLNTASLERLSLESGLRRALEKNEFTLHYQAKRDMQSGRITGMEALLRWQHPDLGTVAPMQFIPVAEETGLIVPIGKWVLRTACRQNVEWQKQGLSPVTVAVNLTARQFFDKDLLLNLKEILAETGMDAQLLELEITESLLMRDAAKTLRVLQGFRELGVRIAIDDFGTGYSSLSTLTRFPLNTIKIDRSFIRDLTRVAEDKSLTEAIIAMGRMLSLTVVAQGVETKEQAEYLRQNACDEFQGFYFNKPLPATEMTELLRMQPAAADSAWPRADLAG
jgi:diguanylate cyclase (GGDEF)-like protein